MREKDTLHRFLIESANTRGALVSLDDAWAEARGRVNYPDNIQQVLGQAFAATVLLCTTIKFEGKMTLQIRGDGAIHLLVIQVTADLKMRGLARWNQIPDSDSLGAMFGQDARMTITIEANATSEPYQGIVALEGNSLCDALQSYFRNSEQLDTELLLSVDNNSACGMLLQRLPAELAVSDLADSQIDAWNRAKVIGQTLTDKELLTTSVESILHKLYHEESVRLFDAQAIQFHCACSTQRTDGLIQGLGLAEAQDILKEQGDITITCEFCDQVYRYTTEDVSALFQEDEDSSEITGPTLH